MKTLQQHVEAKTELKGYRTMVYVDGQPVKEEPMLLFFKNAFEATIQIMKTFNNDMTKSITIKLKRA